MASTPLLMFIVEKLSNGESTDLPNNTIQNVRDNVADLLLDEEFPHSLVPTQKNTPTLSMHKQGHCPPWVHGIAPKIFQQLQVQQRE